MYKNSILYIRNIPSNIHLIINIIYYYRLIESQHVLTCVLLRFLVGGKQNQNGMFTLILSL